MNNLTNPLENLKVVSLDGITIYELETGEQVILGRELHEKLKIETPYSIWFPRMCEDYDFKENIDYYPFFTSVYKNVKRSEKGGHRLFTMVPQICGM